MEPRAMVVQAHTRLPTMAIPHSRVAIPPASLSRLYTPHARRKNAGTFSPPSPHHRSH